MTAIDHAYTRDRIVCPHCGHETDDTPNLDENAYSGTDDCQRCERRYQYECVDTAHYWTTSATT